MKDIGLLLLLQLVLPEVEPPQLVLDDAHAQSSDLKVSDEAVKLGEAAGEEGGLNGPIRQPDVVYTENRPNGPEF